MNKSRARKTTRSRKRAQQPSAPKPVETSSAGRPLELASKAQFEREIRDTGAAAILDFWAPWCGPCRVTAPEFAAAAKVYGDQVRFCKVNTEQNQALARAFGVRSIPTLVLMHEGKVVDVHVGAARRAAIERMAQGLIRRADRAARKTDTAESGGLVGRFRQLLGGGAASTPPTS